MKKQAKVLKLGLMAAILAFAICPVIMIDDAKSAEDEIARIPFALETLKAQKMPQVFFSHDLHIAALEDDCSPCHTASDVTFLDSEEKSAKDVVAYVHKECVSCHAGVASGKATGPLLASCRSCHSESIAAAQAATEQVRRQLS